MEGSALWEETQGEETNSVDCSQDVISWQKADRCVGEQVTVEGTVRDVYDEIEGWKFLNFGTKTGDFNAPIKQEDFDKFPNITKLEEKKVQISGEIETYRESPQINLTDPNQLKALE